MIFKKMSRTKVVISTAVLVVSVLIGYLWRDLHLGENAGDISIPDLVVENIEIKRLINDKQWKLISPRIEHKDGVVYGKSFDITITEKNGKTTKIKAVNGMFTRSNNDITLVSADAVMADKDKIYTFLSGKVKFVAKEEIWYFSNRVTVTDGKLKIEGQNGRYETKSGNCLITSGGIVKWDE